MNIFSIRQELYHPLSVHFPIVILIFSHIFYAGSSVFKSNQSNFLKLFKFSLYLGLGFFVVSMFLGDEALNVVGLESCSIQSIHQHEDYSYYTLYIYMFIAVCDLINDKYKKRILSYFIHILFIAATYLLILTSHLGAKLVYDQGLGVKGHVKDCHKSNTKN